MSQKQSTTYQSDILSYPLRDSMVGILQPGRYKGFDSLTEYQAQSGDIIYVQIGQTNGQNKYDGDGADPPTLEAERSIAVTTQGVIIAEDFVAAAATYRDSLTLTTAPVNGIYHILYMEHIYDDVNPGANPATYGWVSGTDNDTPPALPSPTKQIALGYLYQPKESSGVFPLCEWYLATPVVGDIEMVKDLFKLDANGVRIDKGTIPAGGIIGNRDYSANYLTIYSSITAALSALDAALKVRANAITTLQGTKLDDWAIPDDNIDLNATSTYHGLLPKLPTTNSTLKFLRGDGTYTVPPGGRFVMMTGTFGTHLTLTDADPDAGQIDLGVAGVPADADVLLIHVQITTKSTTPTGYNVTCSFRVAATGGYNGECRAHNNHDAAAAVTKSCQITIPCNSSQNVYYQLGNKTYLQDCFITVVGWQTYTP